MPDGVAALARLGVAATISHGFPFHGIRFVEDGSSAEACFPEGYGLGIRRPVLHQLLIERALADGVVLRWATPVSAIDGGAVEAGGRTVRCRWMLGADGTNSRVRRWAALEPVWSSVMRVGLRQHFRVAPWTDFVEVHWRDRCQAYITPVGPNEICIALIGDRAGLRFADLTALFPELGRRLAGATPIGSTRGADLGVHPVAPRDPREARVDRRCFRIGRRDHRRRTCAGVPAGDDSGRGVVERRPHDIPGGPSANRQDAPADVAPDAGAGWPRCYAAPRAARAVLPAAHVQPAIGGSRGRATAVGGFIGRRRLCLAAARGQWVGRPRLSVLILP